MKLKVKNIFGEDLDVLIEGNKKAKNVILFVHGYGTDKDENFASFIDLSNFLSKEFLIVRFDLSGYGKSQGKDNEFQFHKASGDVDSMIRWIRKNHPNKKINILAHSLGTFVVSLLSPYEINKIIFTSIVNSNTKYVSKWLEKRIRKRGGKIDKNGITIYPRNKGSVQKIGSDFWKTLENIKPIELINDLNLKSDLIIFRPIQDDVLDNAYFDDYRTIKNLKYVEIEGNHNFTDPKDRNELFVKIKEFLNN